ncbi:hypothetical protein KAK07_01455 [Ideonella sp. 4Y16]|uniref:hypothetical protein n=1 Tax=Ideonella alba TaxID=2824118 RepID=UPI001B37E438|nr:hypothetical protein [Ideonella alba]MBQ0941992.1 hypothetical protein [Ideonella alba]
MNGREPTYRELRDVASRAFREATEKRHLTDLQAFAFAYEHLAIFIDGDDAWRRLLALTAAFKAAAEVDLKLLDDSPFTEDVLIVLRGSYEREAPSELSRHQGTSGGDDLQADMELVTTRFLRNF